MSIRSFFRVFGIIAILWNVPASPSASAALPAHLPLPPSGCEIVGHNLDTGPASASLKPVFPPVQLEIRTSFEPTVFPSAGRNYLIYELYLQNFTSAPLTVRGIEVINADNAIEEPIAEINAEQLDALLRPIGIDKMDDPHGLGAGQSVIAFLCLAFEGNTPVPNKLRHRVLLDSSVAEGPVIETHHNTLQVLGSPVAGTGWTAAGGPSIHSHHRPGVFVAGGLAQISRRYALDWKKLKQGSSSSGGALDVRSYYAYGEKVLAVADGTIVAAKDGLPDNVPRTAAGFETAVPITMENIAGNSIVLDLGDGQFAYYAHLQPGSLSVKTGDRVRRGQLLARIGNSGDAREPHLHFQVTTSPDILASEGVPYLIDSYRMKVAGGDWQTRTREFPLGDIVIDFGADTAKAQK